jgi:hypothetical protein
MAARSEMPKRLAAYRAVRVALLRLQATSLCLLILSIRESPKATVMLLKRRSLLLRLMRESQFQTSRLTQSNTCTLSLLAAPLANLAPPPPRGGGGEGVRE